MIQTLEGRGVRVDISEDGTKVEVSVDQRSLALTAEQWEWVAMVAGPSVVIALRRDRPSRGGD